MNTFLKFLLPTTIVGFVMLILVVALGVTWGLGTYNDEASQKNLYEMKVKDNESEYDNMWKQVSQVCQLADSKKNAFKEIFTAWATASTPQDSGKMMLWIKQASPVTDLTVYDKAQNIIVATRNGWTMRQKELVAIASQYNNNLVVQPKGCFLKAFGFAKIDPQIVTSTRTEKAFVTGKDDDVNLSTPAK